MKSPHSMKELMPDFQRDMVVTPSGKPYCAL